MLQPSKQKQNGQTNRTTQQKVCYSSWPVYFIKRLGYAYVLWLILNSDFLFLKSAPTKKPMASGSSFSAPSRPSQSVATSSFSHPGTSSFGSSMGFSTPSYGMAGINSGNTGMGSGMSGYAGMSSMNTGMTGLSTSGMNSSMTGLSSINPTMSGSFGMNPASSSPRYPSAGSSAGNQTKSSSGSTALDSLFAPELGHLQNKSKPSMNTLQYQQAGMQAGNNPGINPGTFCDREEWGRGWLSLLIECMGEVAREFCFNFCSHQCSLKTPVYM